MSSFVLIHGSWHGAWCWNKIVPLLTAAGHRVVTPDLPGHGDDRTPISEITMDSYAERVCEAVCRSDEPVILVGHSMGGGAITQAVESCSAGIRLLVYLAAYIPGDGDSVAQQAMLDGESLVNKHVVVDPVTGTAELDAGVVRECFYGDCSAEDVAYALQRLCRDPLTPLTNPLSVRESRQHAVPRVYIECLKDRTLTPAMQREMYTRWHCERIFSLDTSHSPFFSAPELLVDHLLSAAALAA
jgi:pimeloyl-ACP methyl ester carboxylesterase